MTNEKEGINNMARRFMEEQPGLDLFEAKLMAAKAIRALEISAKRKRIAGAKKSVAA